MTQDGYRTYDPLGVLKPVAENIWIVDGPEIRFRYALLRIPFPTRMTVVRLPDGGLWLHSPTPADRYPRHNGTCNRSDVRLRSGDGQGCHAGGRVGGRLHCLSR